MNDLVLRQFHERLGARFVSGPAGESIDSYGDESAEYEVLRKSAGAFDLSTRGRLCLTGTDRISFLHGQVTNDVKKLQAGEGCYAALITAKGKMISDLNVYRLADEVLLDFEPGLTQKVRERLEQFVIADDVQVVDVAPLYGLISVQGALAEQAGRKLAFAHGWPAKPMSFTSQSHSAGEIYLVNSPRLGMLGFDLFLPTEAVPEFAEMVSKVLAELGGRWCGMKAFEVARIEAGLPLFGVDMDESNLPPEAGLEERAISYTKGCYIGQEVLSRIRTFGQVAKRLRGMKLEGDTPVLPIKGDKLFLDGKEVGFITSAVRSPALGRVLALGYVRKEVGESARLTLRTSAGEAAVQLVELPLV